MYWTFIAIILFANFALAINGRTTYQAKIFKPDGNPLEESSINFRFTVMDHTGTCVLYVESYSSVNMTGSGGLTSFSLGSGTRTYPVSATSFASVFDNSIGAFNCQSSGSYNPTSTDNRKIVMQFQDSAGWQTLPAININAVPYAMFASKSQNSLTLNNKADSAFVEYSALTSLNCTASEAIHFNGTSFSCLPVSSVTSTTVTGALGFTPVAPTSFTALSTQVTNNYTNLSTSYTTLVSDFSSLSSSLSTIVSSQWTTSGTAINYSNGIVGIGTSAPNEKLQVASSDSTIYVAASTTTRRPWTQGGSAAVLSVQNSSSTDNAAAYLELLTTGNSGTTKPAYIGAFNDPTTFFGAATTVFGRRTNNNSYSESMRITGDGNVGIGTIFPSAKLHLAAGTATNASLKLTSGTLLSSPQSGTIEYDGLGLYFTDGNNNRRALATNSGSGAFEDTNTISNSSGNITLAPNNSTGSVVVSATTVSTNSQTGALVIKGGMGITGDIYSTGAITTSSNIQGASLTATSGLISPYLSGSILSGGSLTLDSTNHPSKGNILMALGGGNVGVGTPAPNSAFSVVTVLPSAPTTNVQGVNINVTGAGSPAFSQYGLVTNLEQGYTGGRSSIAGQFINSSRTGSGNGTITAGSYQSPIGVHGSVTNMLVANGVAYGVVGDARNASAGGVGIGVAGLPQNSQPNSIGVLGATTAGTATNFGGYFVLGHPNVASLPTSSALLADNGSTTANIFTAQDNGSTVFSITDGGNVGIGFTNPASPLHVITGATIERFGGSSPHLVLRGVAGTQTLPTATVSGGGIGKVSGNNFDGTSYFTGASMSFLSTENITNTNKGSALFFTTTSNGTANELERMRISDTGNVGIGTTAPTAKLEVSGSVRATGNIVSTKQVVAGFFTVATGATVDFDNGNVQALQDVGTDQIDLLNMLDGGSYTLIIEDETARMYTFNQCTSARYVPANANTLQGSRTIYNIVKTPTTCYISWTAGY